MNSSQPAVADEAPPLIPSTGHGVRAAVGLDTEVLIRITAMAFGLRGRMLLALIVTAAAAAAQIVIPHVIGAAVDQVQTLLGGAGGVSRGATEALRAEWSAAARGELMATAAMLLGLAALRGVFTMGQNYLGETIGHRIAHRLRLDFYARLQRLSFAYHDQVHTGELMTRGILDIEGVRMWISTGVLRAVLLAVLLVGGAAMLVSVDPVLTLVALAFVPVVGVGAAVGRLRLRQLWHRLQDEFGVLTRIMEDNLGGIRVVRSFAARDFEMRRFDYVSDRARAIAARRIRVFVLSTTTMTFVFFLHMGLVLWVGGERVLAGHITLGELTAFLAFMTILQQPVRQIAWLVNSIARASTCGSRLFEILDLEPEIQDRPGAQPLTSATGRLSFESVSFEYPRQTGSAVDAADRAQVLDDISFEVGPGQVLGIVGPPGSGKSTLAHLIPRFYEANSGRICIDGVDVRDIELASLRRLVSLVQQDAYLFTSTIASNVAYADPWADRSAVRRSAEAAQLHNYIQQLPEHYDTLVGERGVSLSGGQRQRLAIARSVLPGSRIIVFDDATAAIDAATERRIREELAELTRTRTVIVAAHRLSSVRHADEILFLDAGRIVERGDHESLLALDGRYAELFSLQTRGSATTQTRGAGTTVADDS